MILYDLKPGVTLDGVHPYMRAGVLPVVYGVTLAVCGRKPIITGARVDRISEEGDDPATLHDNGLALDLRGNDLTDATRARYASVLRAALWPFGVDVVGPYDLPLGHIHVEIDPDSLMRAVAFGLALVLLLL